MYDAFDNAGLNIFLEDFELGFRKVVDRTEDRAGAIDQVDAIVDMTSMGGQGLDRFNFIENGSNVVMIFEEQVGEGLTLVGCEFF